METQNALVIVLSDKVMRGGRKKVFPIIGERIVEFLLCKPNIKFPNKVLITRERDAELRADEFTITFE